MLKLFIVCFIIVYFYAWIKEIKESIHENEMKKIKQIRKNYNIDIN